MRRPAGARSCFPRRPALRAPGLSSVSFASTATSATRAPAARGYRRFLPDLAECRRPRNDRERLAEKRDLVRRPGRDPQRVGGSEGRERAYNHALAQERRVQRLRVSGPDEHEVGDGRADRREAILNQHGDEERHRLAVRLPPPRDLVRVAEARKSGLLPRGADVEGTAHLPDRRDELLRPDAVPDSQAGKAVDLRERTQDDDAVAGLEVLLDRVRV